MNLVTTGNATVSVATFIVGLWLVTPRANLAASVRYLKMTMRPSVDEPVATEAESVSVCGRSATRQYARVNARCHD